MNYRDLFSPSGPLLWEAKQLAKIERQKQISQQKNEVKKESKNSCDS